MIPATPSETIRLEQEIWFDGHQYGSDTGIPDGQIKIQRSSDDMYWNSASWQASPIYIATVVDGGGLFHYYDFTVGSTVNESYKVNLRANGDVETELVFNVLVVSEQQNITPTVDTIGLTTGIPFTVKVV